MRCRSCGTSTCAERSKFVSLEVECVRKPDIAAVLTSRAAVRLAAGKADELPELVRRVVDQKVEPRIRQNPLPGMVQHHALRVKA